MIKSMTAYAGYELNQDDVAVAVEIRAVNSRHLDVALRMPPGYAILEEKIKHRIGETVTRGRIEIRLQVKETTANPSCFEVDWERARSYMDAVHELKNNLELSSDLSLDHIASVSGVIQIVEKAPQAEDHWLAIDQCLQQALTDLDRMRQVEGDFIRKDFVERLAFIEKGLDQIEKDAQGVLGINQEKLAARIGSLTQGLVELDAARIAQEAAMLADRSDISEEIVRARSHLEQFRALIASQEAAGRKINFLLQELNREFNTMGAKVGQADAAHAIVDIKAELEKLREQIQNIE